MPASPARALVLVGFMGAGKTTVGRALSKRLGWQFEDLDERIERREQKSVAEIFQVQGEYGFRRAERAALMESLEELKSGTAKILALGGGAFVNEKNRALIEESNVLTLFLDAGPEESWRRCAAQREKDGTERPLLKTGDTFRALYHLRRPHYLKAAYRQQTSRRSVDEIVEEIIQTARTALGRSKTRKSD
ncbi:MAG TPA: shikimate kinase [Candidatus Binatia bacterium]|nr:shikimate kinase [Candidatus Binatia bacterium]